MMNSNSLKFNFKNQSLWSFTHSLKYLLTILIIQTTYYSSASSQNIELANNYLTEKVKNHVPNHPELADQIKKIQTVKTEINLRELAADLNIEVLTLKDAHFLNSREELVALQQNQPRYGELKEGETFIWMIKGKHAKAINKNKGFYIFAQKNLNIDSNAEFLAIKPITISIKNFFKDAIVISLMILPACIFNEYFEIRNRDYYSRLALYAFFVGVLPLGMAYVVSNDRVTKNTAFNQAVHSFGQTGDLILEAGFIKN